MGNAIAVVGRINDILARHMPVDAASLAGLAGDYQNLRKEAARRLSKFCALHSAGQEPQAVELAETTPALPGLLRVLDFEGQHEWNALLEKHRLPPLVAFTPKQLQLLAETYAKSELLEPLKSFHASLQAAGSTAEQIARLRKLHELEPQSPQWKSQLATFEKRRQDEIKKIVLAERPQITSYEADGLVAELAESALTIRPDPMLAPAAATLRTELRRRNTGEAIENLAARLQTVFTELNFLETGEILTKLDRVLNNGRVAIPPAHAAAVQSAREWYGTVLADYQEHLATLEGLLDDHAETRQVRWVIQDIEAAGYQLPPVLRQRATTYLTYQELVEVREVKQKRVALAVGVLGLAGAVAAALFWK